MSCRRFITFLPYPMILYLGAKSVGYSQYLEKKKLIPSLFFLKSGSYFFERF